MAPCRATYDLWLWQLGYIVERRDSQVNIQLYFTITITRSGATFNFFLKKILFTLDCFNFILFFLLTFDCINFYSCFESSQWHYIKKRAEKLQMMITWSQMLPPAISCQAHRLWSGDCGGIQMAGSPRTGHSHHSFNTIVMSNGH